MASIDGAFYGVSLNGESFTFNPNTAAVTAGPYITSNVAGLVEPTSVLVKRLPSTPRRPTWLASPRCSLGSANSEGAHRYRSIRTANRGPESRQ
jgi:hypothetical protein